MKTVLRSAVSLIAFTSLAISLHAAGYLKIDGVNGESVDKDHKDWIEILSVSDLPAKSPRDAASGMATGKRQHKPITIVKTIDKATPMLAKAVQADSGKVKAKAAAPVMKLSHDGKTYLLHGAKLVSSTSKDGKETLVIDYDSCEIIETSPAPRAPAAAAQDHNSSRSNKTSN